MISYKKVAFLIVLLTILIIGAFFLAKYFISVKTIQPQNNNEEKVQEKIIEQKTEPGNQKIKNRIFTFKYTKAEFDSAIFLDDQPFIASTIESCGSTLKPLVLEEQNHNLYFFNARPGIEYSPSAIFRINTETKICTKLGVSQYLKGFFGYKLAADKMRLAFIPENDTGLDRELDVLDLDKDSVANSFYLQDNETFNEGTGIVNSNYTLDWLDSNTLIASVFTAYGEKSELDNRVFKISE